MSYLQEHKDILGRFELLWDATIPVDYPNDSFSTPERNEDVAWLRIRVKDDTPPSDIGPQLTIGAEQNDCRFSGQIMIQVFTDSDISYAKAFTLAEAAGDIFKKWHSDNGVICRIPLIREIGQDAQGWYQVNCIIPFIRNAII